MSSFVINKIEFVRDLMYDYYEGNAEKVIFSF